MNVWNDATAYRYATHKTDGWSCTIEVDENRDVTARTSGGKLIKLDGCDFLETIAANVPAYTRIVGELHVPGGTADAVATAIKTSGFAGELIGNVGVLGRAELAFVVFAVPEVDGMQIGEWSLLKTRNLVTGWGLAYHKYELFTVKTAEAWVKRADQLGIEGWVFKNQNAGGPEVKCKPVHTIDVPVVGFNAGKAGCTARSDRCGARPTRVRW